MLNFSVYKYLIGTFLLYFIIAFVWLIFEKPWKKGVKRVGCMCALILLIVSTVVSCFFVYKRFNPDVNTYVGEYVESYRHRGLLKKYVFGDGIGKNRVFYLDVFSAKEIFKEQPVEGNTYVVFYENVGRYLLGVEGQGDGS